MKTNAFKIQKLHITTYLNKRIFKQKISKFYNSLKVNKIRKVAKRDKRK